MREAEAKKKNRLTTFGYFTFRHTDLFFFYLDLGFVCLFAIFFYKFNDNNKNYDSCFHIEMNRTEHFFGANTHKPRQKKQQQPSTRYNLALEDRSILIFE